MMTLLQRRQAYRQVLDMRQSRLAYYQARLNGVLTDNDPRHQLQAWQEYRKYATDYWRALIDEETTGIQATADFIAYLKDVETSLAWYAGRSMNR